MPDSVVGYNGVCPLCGSMDGMIVKGADGLFRNICRVMGCPAFYLPAPFEGYTTKDDAQNPSESNLIQDGTCTIGRYLKGEIDNV